MVTAMTERRLVFPDETTAQHAARSETLRRFDNLLLLIEAEIEYGTQTVGPTLASCYQATMAQAPGVGRVPKVLGTPVTALHERVLDTQELYTNTPWVQLKSGLVSETTLSELAGRRGPGPPTPSVRALPSGQVQGG
jgi:hypothetical protein